MQFHSSMIYRLNPPAGYSVPDFFILATSADTAVMLHIAAFHLSLHRLQKYPVMGFQ